MRRQQRRTPDLRLCQWFAWSEIEHITYSNGGVDVLGEQNTLTLNDEEVNELLNVVQAGLQRLPRDGVVLPWAHPGGKAVVKQQLTSDFERRSNYYRQHSKTSCGYVFTHFQG